MRTVGTWTVTLFMALVPSLLPAQTIDRHGVPSVACTADGGFVVVWHSRGQDGDGYGVIGQRFASGGTPAGAEFFVNTYSTDDQRAPAVCSDGQGSFVVAWQSYGQDGDGNGISARAFDSFGRLPNVSFQVSTGSSYSQQDVAIACANDGGFVVVWSGGDADGEDYGIVGRRFSSTGSSPAGDFNVNAYTSSSQVAPSVAMVPGGGFVVVWTSYEDQDGAGYGVFGQRFSSSGTKEGTEFLVNTYTGNSQLAPAVAADANGRFVVAWSSAQDTDAGYGIFGQGFASNGDRDGGELHVNTHTEGDQGVSLGGGRVLDVATGAGDGLVVVWQSTSLSEPSQDGDGIGVFGQRFAGIPPAPVGSEFQANSATAGDQAYPSVCATTSGEFVVAWEGRGGEIDGIFAQRYDASGAPNGSEMRVSSDTARPYSQCPGDCNQTNSVGVNELVIGVNIALGQRSIDTCPAFDTDNSDTITVDELVTAVRAALQGCPSPGTSTPRPTATPNDPGRTRGIPPEREP